MNQTNPDFSKAAAVGNPQRIAVWDGWRGLAIACVLSGHFYNIPGLREERLGVDIFFVLSGMLISNILFTRHISLKDFYIRRFSRIYPTYFVFVLSMYIIGAVFSIDFSTLEILSNLTFLRTYIPSAPHIWETDVAVRHLWSLNVEEHAYLLMSLVTLFVILRKNVGWLFIAISFMAMAWGLLKYTSMPEPEFKLFMLRTESAITFILFSAGYNLLKRKHGWRVNPWFPAITLMLGIACYSNLLPLWVICTISPILLAVTVNHLQELAVSAQRVLSVTPLRMLGVWSYSIYLWQQFFYMYSWKIPGGMASGMALALAVGIGSFYILENPARIWINRKYSSSS